MLKNRCAKEKKSWKR